MDKEQVIKDISKKAEDLYLSKQLMCSESVLVAINNALGPWINEDHVVGIMSGFPAGLGGYGCLCGAVSGGVAALGLALSGKYSRAEIRKYSDQLYKDFLNNYKSTCCRVLIKDVKHDKKEHFSQCAGITASVAEMSARMIIDLRPDALKVVNEDYLAQSEGVIRAIIRRVREILLRWT